MIKFYAYRQLLINEQVMYERIIDIIVHACFLL